MKSILLVTEDIDGNTINSGVGTYVREIAYLLNDEGFDVSILVERDITRKYIDEYYTRRGIKVYFVGDLYTDSKKEFDSAHWILRRSHLVYNAIVNTGKHFDIIEFPDFTGSAFIPIRMKKYCGSFKTTTLLVKMHGYLLWHCDGMGDMPNKDAVLRDYIDRYCIEQADEVISPSQHLIDYTSELYGITRDITLVRNPINDNFINYEFSNQSSIVFFGRLEERKGVLEFINAIKVCNIQLPIIFVGMSASISRRKIKHLLQGFNVSFYTGPTRDATLKYVADHAKFVVIPSRLDNYPTTVIECINSGIPFITVNTGGIPEMLGELKDVISCNLRDLPKLLDKACNVQSDEWLDYTQYLKDNLGVIANHSDITKYYMFLQHTISNFTQCNEWITLLMPYKDGSEFIKETLDSIALQTYGKFKLLIVDDSNQEESNYLMELISQYSFEVEIVKGNHISVGNALNQGVNLISTDYFIQVDADNIFRPNLIQAYINAVYNNPHVDVLTSYNDAFGDWDQIYYPIGPIKEVLPIKNEYGDACAIYKTSTIKQIGFPSVRGVIVDWAMWNKMINAECFMDIVPLVLVDYRARNAGHSSQIQHTAMYTHNIQYVKDVNFIKMYGMIVNTTGDNTAKDFIDFVKSNPILFKLATFVGYRIIKRIL